MAALDGLNFNEEGAGLGDIEGKPPPTQKELDWLHGRASTTRKEDLHHRVGTGPDDVAAGNHIHDGRDSYPLFDGVTLNDLTPTSTGTQIANAVNAINALLRTKGAS